MTPIFWVIVGLAMALFNAVVGARSLATTICEEAEK